MDGPFESGNTNPDRVAPGGYPPRAPTDPIAEQHAVLCRKLQGHAAYYGITGNSPALARFRHEVLWVWRKWLLRRRRAWPARASWFSRLLKRYPVPYLRAVHSVYRGVANG